MGANHGSGTCTGSGVPAGVEAFIARWSGREGGWERANYEMLLTELFAALALPPLDPAGDRTELNDYVSGRGVREAAPLRTGVGGRQVAEMRL